MIATSLFENGRYLALLVISIIVVGSLPITAWVDRKIPRLRPSLPRFKPSIPAQALRV